jgi:DNA-binding MarR family transcriptional regulator
MRKRPSTRTATADARIDALLRLVEIVPSLFFKLKALTDALHADDTVTTAERGVLRDLVERGAMTSPAIAALRPVSRQAIQPVLDRLLERDLVTLEDNPRHARSSLYQPTRAGRDLMRALRRRETSALAAASKRFGGDELASTVSTLARLEEMLTQELKGWAS